MFLFVFAKIASGFMAVVNSASRSNLQGDTCSKPPCIAGGTGYSEKNARLAQRRYAAVLHARTYARTNLNFSGVHQCPEGVRNSGIPLQLTKTVFLYSGGHMADTNAAAILLSDSTFQYSEKSRNAISFASTRRTREQSTDIAAYNSISTHKSWPPYLRTTCIFAAILGFDASRLAGAANR